MKTIKIIYEDSERDIKIENRWITELIFEDIKDFNKRFLHEFYLLLSNKELVKLSETKELNESS